jgi:CheY-like chemotaxis protein
VLLSALGGALVASVVAIAVARRRAAAWRDATRRAQTEAQKAKDDADTRLARELAAQSVAANKEIASLLGQLRAFEERAQSRARDEEAEQSKLDPRPSELARALSRELATIVSAIEGGTFRLVETSSALREQNDAVEALWLAVRRLRRFHGKVAGFAHPPVTTVGSVPIDKLLTSLREELNATALGLQMSWDLPQPSLRLFGDPDDLLLALTMATTALHHLERGALRLSAHLEPNFDREVPEVHVELSLERDEGLDAIAHPKPPGAPFLIARTAAIHLLRAYGARVSFSHRPGIAASALVQMPLLIHEDEQVEGAVDVAAPSSSSLPHADAEPAHEPIVEIPRKHRYGGVLVIEEDAGVRSMLAAELKAQGRAVFACPDGAAARSLIQATPDRFEFLVVDHASRLDAGDLLATTAAKLCPELRIVVLSDSKNARVPAPLAARVTEIRKPFGVQELRRGLAAALTD